MARAKGRVAELASSNAPRASWEWDWEELEWGAGPTWAADTWAPPSSTSEAPRTVPSTSDANAGNGNASGPAPSAAAAGRDHDVVVLVVGSGGFRCVPSRPGSHSHRCRYKCGFGGGRTRLAAVGRCTCVGTMYSCSPSSIQFNPNLCQHKQPVSFACRSGCVLR